MGWGDEGDEFEWIDRWTWMGYKRGWVCCLVLGIVLYLYCTLYIVSLLKLLYILSLFYKSLYVLSLQP